MKRYFALSLSTLALLGALTACSQGEEPALTGSSSSNSGTSSNEETTNNNSNALSAVPSLPPELSFDQFTDLSTASGEEFQVDATEEAQLLSAYTGTAEHVMIPEGVTKVSSHLFGQNEAIQVLTLSDSVVEVDNSSFSMTPNLKAIDFGSVQVIGTYSFAGCSSLRYLEFPSSTTSILDSAFYDCASLETVVINEGLTEITSGSFAQCPSLTAVVLPSSVTKISETAFDVTDNMTFFVTEGSFAYDWAQAREYNMVVV